MSFRAFYILILDSKWEEKRVLFSLYRRRCDVGKV